MNHMGKTATLNLRVNPTVKRQAEEVLLKLGVPMSTAIDMYLNQIYMTGGIPFAATLPKVLESINADLMTAEELYTKVLQGIEDADAGRTQNTKEVFRKFREANF